MLYHLASKYKWALNTVLLILILSAGLTLFRDLLTARFKADQNTPDLKKSTVDPAKIRFEDFELAVTNNPFGLPEKILVPLSEAGKAQASSSAAVSGGVLTLYGVVAGPKGLSCAIITDASGRQEVFRAGQSVFGAGSLERLERDEVFIKGGNGQTFRLKLVSAWMEKGGSPDPKASSAFANRVQEKEFLIDRNKLMHVLDNPAELMTDARLFPYTRDGKPEGFVLKEVKPSGIYQCLGLRNGDILLRMNDYDIRQPEHILHALGALRGLDRVKIDVIREDERVTLTYQIG